MVVTFHIDFLYTIHNMKILANAFALNESAGYRI